jgi:hypothetical protein
VYHVELRQFPHLHCRFNLTEDELRALVLPWVRGAPVELGERKWSVHQAKLTVLEGPQLAVQELAMGRGWRAAERQSENVTERVIASANQAVASAASAAAHGGPATHPAVASTDAPSPSASGGLLNDPLALGVQIAALLGSDATQLLDAWRATAARAPTLAPSESLALAEHQLRTPDESTP